MDNLRDCPDVYDGHLRLFRPRFPSVYRTPGRVHGSGQSLIPAHECQRVVYVRLGATFPLKNLDRPPFDLDPEKHEDLADPGLLASRLHHRGVVEDWPALKSGGCSKAVSLVAFVLLGWRDVEGVADVDLRRRIVRCSQTLDLV